MSKAFRYILLMLSFLLFFVGKFYSYNIMLCGILTLWVHNILYSLEKKSLRTFFLVFNIVVFVFLISRPAISMIKRSVWWYFSFKSVNFALNSLMITLFFLFIGEYFFENIFLRGKNLSQQSKKDSPRLCGTICKHISRQTPRESLEIQKHPFGVFMQSDKKFASHPKPQSSSGIDLKFEVPVICKSNFMFALRSISLVLFYFSCAFMLMVEAEKLLYMRGKDYLEIYTSFKTSLPYIVTVIGSMYKYFLCIFLSTWPKKSVAFFPLAIYVILAVPDLLIGIRNTIVLNIIFALLYYFIRDAVGDKEKWLGLFEKSVVVMLAPVAIVILGAYNYIRDASSSGVAKNFFELIVDFLYKQGVSFEVLCIGYESIPKIKYTGFTNYTFGGIIDYFKHSKISQALWGGVYLGEGNNINRALYSNNFAHRMSYVSRGQEYLEGHGWGSSYILETFADFGYLGIIVFSILMGMLLGAIIYILTKGNLGFIFSLVSLTSIYFCPRYAALGWLEFVIYLQFWAAFLICYGLAKLCVKQYDYVCIENHNNKILNIKRY